MPGALLKPRYQSTLYGWKVGRLLENRHKYHGDTHPIAPPPISLHRLPTPDSLRDDSFHSAPHRSTPTSVRRAVFKSQQLKFSCPPCQAPNQLTASGARQPSTGHRQVPGPQIPQGIFHSFSSTDHHCEFPLHHHHRLTTAGVRPSQHPHPSTRHRGLKILSARSAAWRPFVNDL
ncbi:hypothetical protein VTK26DRAFT_8933 [Humicola hyalothermophila]